MFLGTAGLRLRISNASGDSTDYLPFLFSAKHKTLGKWHYIDSQRLLFCTSLPPVGIVVPIPNMTASYLSTMLLAQLRFNSRPSRVSLSVEVLVSHPNSESRVARNWFGP